jgi:hypothetical protein
VSAAERAATVLPWLAEHAIRYAGDIGAARLYDEASLIVAQQLEPRKRI